MHSLRKIIIAQKTRLWPGTSLDPLLRIHIPPRPNFRPPFSPSSLPSQNSGQIILIHQIGLLLPVSAGHSTLILFLIFRQNQLLAPTTFAASPTLTYFAVGSPRDQLRYAVAIAAVVPLHVLLEMELELALCVG